MKTIKLFALMLVALVGMTACSDDDDNEPKLIIDPVEQTGYIFVSAAYFQDMYYGNNARLGIYPKDGQYSVEFHDPQWGDVTFENVTIDEAHHTVAGTGELTMVYRGKEGTYDATLSGDLTNPTISLPDVMGGTTISFYLGEAPLACQLNGSYAGTTSVMVGGNFGPYTVSTTYKITPNPDGTLNVEIPEHMLPETAMGDLTLGKVTIKNLYYDSANDRFYREYGKLDELSMHFKSEGTMAMEGDYNFGEASEIEVKVTDNGIKVVNTYLIGNMPFPIVATFEGAIASGK